MEGAYDEYIKQWNDMYRADALYSNPDISRDEEVKLVALQNLARNLRQEEYAERSNGQPQDLQMIVHVLQKVKSDYENEYQDAEEHGTVHPRMQVEHATVTAELDLEIKNAEQYIGKSQSTKEGITMAWNQPAEKKPEMSCLDKKTRDAKENKALSYNQQLNEMANKMLEVAEAIGLDIREQGLTTKSNTREGQEYVNKFVVSVKPAVDNGKALFHKADNSPVLSATITHKIGNSSLTLYAKEDMSNGVQISSMTAQRLQFTKDEQGKTHMSIAERAKGAEIQNGQFNDYLKKVAARIEETGLIQEAQKNRQSERTPAMEFAFKANQYFRENGGKVMRDDGTTKADAWAKYNPPTEKFGETVQLKSNSEKSIVVELSTSREGKPVAKATNFDVKHDNGRFASIYINTPADFNKEELATVPKEIKDVVAEFKGFDKQREQTAPAKKPKPKQQGMEM